LCNKIIANHWCRRVLRFSCFDMQDMYFAISMHISLTCCALSDGFIYRRNMILMIQKVLRLWYCHFWEKDQRLLRLWQHKTLFSLSRNLVFVQHLAEVELVTGTYMPFNSVCNILYVYMFHLSYAETNQRICFLNVSPDEVIRSLFYNKNNDSLITVSVYASDSYSSLKCRSTRIEYV